MEAVCAPQRGDEALLYFALLFFLAMFYPTVCSSAIPAVAEGPGGKSWRDLSHRATLANKSLEASFQCGLLFRLQDRRTGRVLVSIEPDQLPGRLPIFSTSGIDLGACTVTQRVTPASVTSRFRAPDSTEWELRWSIKPGTGDLVLRTSARTAKPVEEFRHLLFGCGVSSQRVVWVDVYGVGRVAGLPWEGVVLGDPEKDGSPMTYVHPLVALFEGQDSGWFVEGRDAKIGPSCVMVRGRGETVNVGMVRRFPIPTTAPQMYEIRMRTYRDHWEDAVDPYVDWMEKGAGFVPLKKKPQPWVKDVKTQAYVTIGDFDGLEALAKRVDPRKTLVGRQAEFRYYGFDEKYPDYRVRDDAKSWFKRARELGFHVGAHFNSKSVSVSFPELVERFRPGFQVTGTDVQGRETYESIYAGPNELIRVSAALKPWRDYLVEQLREAVEAGVDVIYLDESMCPSGKFVVEGTDGFQGMLSLMKQVLETYPHVAIETEQFNPLTARYGAFALSQMPLGHPLSGYIFHRFVKVVPEGVMYSPTEVPMMDAFDSWGFMLPGADTGREESWVEIAEAVQRYALAPDSRLPRKSFTEFKDHPSSGLTPFTDSPLPPEGLRLFGYRGRGGVTAYFEKRPTKRGLVVYEPGRDPKWFGARLWGITSHEGPGLPVYYLFRQQVRDWLIYNSDALLGLNPKETHWFDKALKRPADRFHVTGIPRDFAGITDWNKRIPPQEVGREDSFFVLTFSGTGEVAMHVPGAYDVYLNGEEVPVNRQTASAIVKVSSTADKPSVLLAFRRSDTELVGSWLKLPWQASPDSGKWIAPNEADGFKMTVGGIGRIIGRMPNARSIRLQGAYRILEEGPGPPGDGVVRINGKEVLRVPHGERPYRTREFDTDVSAFAGRHVLFEFLSDGWTGRSSYAEWRHPRIAVDRTISGGSASALLMDSTRSAQTMAWKSRRLASIPCLRCRVSRGTQTKPAGAIIRHIGMTQNTSKVPRRSTEYS